MPGTYSFKAVAMNKGHYRLRRSKLHRKDDMSSAASQHLPVLTTLCPICYTNPPKYRCPRCSMRTCSMECSKAHKIRAACSGTRDPAKYIPRKEMKASTIDMDYQFLKSVRKTQESGEKKIEKAAKGPSRNKRLLKRAHKRELAVKYAARQKIWVRRLPVWMERAKTNQTEWDGNTKSILWTVEWNITIDSQATNISRHKLVY
jgi:hypothetical protein